MAFSLLPLGAVVLVAHGLGALAACHAILNTRTSQGAVAWAVSLVTMPYLTLVPYLFLGRSKFAGYLDEHREETAQVRPRVRGHAQRGEPGLDWTAGHRSTPSSERLGDHTIDALTALSGMPFLSGNSVRILVNGQQAFPAIFDAIDGAQDYVIVQSFIIRDDRLGRELAAKLIARAAAGVRVHVLYDGIGSFDLPHHYIDKLKRGGVEVHAFSTRRFINRFQLNFRNHRKIVVVDGQRAFVGGLNIGVEYLGEKPPLSPWRDTHLDISGPVVASIQSVFAEDWHWATRRLPTLAPPRRAPDADMHCQVMMSGPADRQETCSLFFVEIINSARRRLWITTPYLIPDEAVFAALRLAVMRGVDVRILIPSRRDHVVVFAASTLYAYDAVCAGIRVFRYQPGFLHQKVVLIDGHAAAIGSANLDNRSFRLNFEIMLNIVDDGFAADIETMLLEDFSHSREVMPEDYRGAAAWRRVAMHVARLFAPIL